MKVFQSLRNGWTALIAKLRLNKTPPRVWATIVAFTILVLLLGKLAFINLQVSKELEVANKEKKAVTQELQTVKLKYKGVEVKAKQGQIAKVESEKQLRMVILQKDSLARVLLKKTNIQPTEYVKVSEKTNLKNISIAYKRDTVVVRDTIRIAANNDSVSYRPDSNYIAVPQHFEKVDTYYNIKGVVGKDSIHFENITFNNEITIVKGTERKGFLGLGKKQDIFYVISKNPYSEITGTQSIIVEKKKGSVFKRLILPAAAFIGGVLIAK